MSRLESYEYVFSVELDYSNILKIDTSNKFKDFHNKYFNGNGIDWNRVSKDYKGIEIIPYRYEFRMEYLYSWYYTWDIPSGCIWDLSAMKDYKVIYKE